MKTKWFVWVPVILLVLFAFALVSAENPAWAQPPNQEIDCRPKKKVFLPLIVRPAETPTPVPTQVNPVGGIATPVAPMSEPGLGGQTGLGQ